MYSELWKPKDYYRPDAPLGSINNPADTNPHSSYSTYYLRKENLVDNYIALYLGYQKRITISYDWTPDSKQYFYLDFIYKKSHETFDFRHYDWDCYHAVLDVMKERGHFDDDVQNALLTLSQEKLLVAILKKLKATGIKPDLSLDWKTGTKWEGK